MFSGEVSPDEVWECVMALPRTSATRAALADDPEIPVGEGEPGDPPWTEFSPEVQAMAEAVDLLKSLLANVISLGGGKPPKFRPYPRPGDSRRREAEKARFADRWRKHKELAARVLRPRRSPTEGGDRG